MWQLTIPLEYETSMGKEFVEKMTGFINQSMTTGNEILQTHLLVLFVDDFGFFHRDCIRFKYPGSLINLMR